MQDCSLDGTGYCLASLSSPLISSGARWKCLQFWLYGLYDNLEVSLVSKLNQTTLHRRQFLAGLSWTRIDVPISVDSPYQVNAILYELLVMLTVVVLFVSSVLLVTCVAGIQVG